MNKRESTKFEKLYHKYLRALKLQGYSDSTIDCYSRGMRRVAEYFDLCPDSRLTKDDLKQYFIDLLKTHSWSTVKHDLNALKHYWLHILDEEWDWVLIVKPPKVHTLPDILTPQEITQVLAKVKQLRYGILFFTLYTLGLRIGEGLSLCVGDIDGKLMRVHIRQGKGRKDRFAKLPCITYHLLRQFWATHHHKKFIFPSTQSNHQHVPMDRGAAQKAIKLAVLDAGIHKHITAHSLRHCYATHLMENGLNLRAVQTLLGHQDPRTTALYTQLTEVIQQDTDKVVNILASRLDFDFDSKESK